MRVQYPKPCHVWWGLNQIKKAMEQQTMYAIYYGSEFMCKIYACTKWEAIERVFSRVASIHPDKDRKKYVAKVVFV